MPFHFSEYIRVIFLTTLLTLPLLILCSPVRDSEIANEVEAQPNQESLSAAVTIYPRDEDDEDEVTVAGPGAPGILAGLNGIFANIVKGDLNKLVESTFNFVPPAYHHNVKTVYNGLLGKPPPKTTTESSGSVSSETVKTVASAAVEEENDEKKQSRSSRLL